MIRQGDKLRIKPEWQDKGDEGRVYVAVDSEEKGRVAITSHIEGWTIQPTHVVRVEMVEAVQ